MELECAVLFEYSIQSLYQYVANCRLAVQILAFSSHIVVWFPILFQFSNPL